NIDVAALARSYLYRVRELEEANFFVSGKVLLVAAILLRLKSERLYEQLSFLDELLFGREESETKAREKIVLEEGELPLILPKTPLPRSRKVTIEELVHALNKAVEVERRREKRSILLELAEKEAAIVLPTTTINIHSKIREIYDKVREFFAKRALEKLTFSELVGTDRREDKILTFVPLLHLDMRKKISLAQREHFGEIEIYLYSKGHSVE
ncbi:MAG: segregation/condensation protein A, partial [Nanoarchaeota archaeon]